MGGSVSVKSIVDKGTEFQINLKTETIVSNVNLPQTQPIKSVFMTFQQSKKNMTRKCFELISGSKGQELTKNFVGDSSIAQSSLQISQSLVFGSQISDKSHLIQMPKCLIANDCPTQLAVLEILLKNQGFEVSKAENGSEALYQVIQTMTDPK